MRILFYIDLIVIFSFLYMHLFMHISDNGIKGLLVIGNITYICLRILYLILKKIIKKS